MDTYYRVAAVIIRDGNLLMVQGRSFPQLWTPGGKLEDGEDDEAALRRELKEELGLETVSIRFFKEYNGPSPFFENTMTKSMTYIVDVQGDPAVGGEIGAFFWVSRQDFLEGRCMLLELDKGLLIPDLIKENLM